MSISAGIDYSMTSPSICIHQGKKWSIDNCKFYYIVHRDKFLVKNDHIQGHLYEGYESQQERFSNLSNWVLNILKENEVQNTGLEGYSYGSTSSRLFEIGENTGLLKYKLWSEKIDFTVFAPTMIKKFATTKGNANKEKMWLSFIEETDLNLFHMLGLEVGKNWNPVSDMVDSYYICKYHYENCVDI